MSETSTSASPVRRWWLPSISAGIWVAFFLALSLTNWRLVLISADGDPSLHWRIGNWMIENRAVIRVEQFSHTRLGAPLVSKEWLSEVAFAAAGNALGWNGAVLLAAGLIATSLWLLHRLLLAEGNELLLSTFLVLLAAMACSMHWLARPHLTTHVLTVVFLWQLRAFDRGRIAAGTLALRLIPLSALWANLHGAFFTGFVLIGVFLAGNLFADRRKAGMLAAVLAGCALASLINPNGWRLHVHILEFLRTPLVAKFANEFRSPNFHSGGMHGFLLELLTLVVMLIWVRPRLTATDVLLTGVWGFFALQSARNVPLFALVVTPMLAEHFTKFLRDVPESRLVALYRKISADVTALDRGASGRITVALVVLAMLAVAAKPRVAGGAPLISSEILTNRFPIAAVEFLRAKPDVVAGQMFNDYGWGGYLMLVLPERKVFVDGRNDFYGEALMKEFDEVDDVRPGWEGVLEKYGVGWTILPNKHALNSVLALRPYWKVVYTDEVAAVRARVSP